ncbi:MAG TPA: aminopeptidase P family protein [Clostridia bacterium]|nr:aminopeptidase P family protein [Clostridia bacterium]
MSAERIAALRARMAKHGMHAYIVPTSDFHSSEHMGAHFQARRYLSDFTGSAGTLAVTAEEAGLWTDGRYFLQAEQQMAGNGVKLFKMGEPGVPTIHQYLSDHMPHGCVLGMDGRVVSAAYVKSVRAALEAQSPTIALERDLVGEIWEDRPPISDAKAFLYPEKYAGKTRVEKLKELREAIAKKGADAHVLTTLDDIAWLFNIRGDDILFEPLVFSYAVVEQNAAHLFISLNKLDADAKAELDRDKVTLHPYEEVYEFVKGYGEGTSVLMCSDVVNSALYELVGTKAIVIDAENPTVAMKTLKNDTELEGMRRAHIKDGVALTRFMRWVKENVGKEKITEVSAGEKARQFRAQMEGFVSPSFNTICGYKEHGAIIHYGATEETDVELKPIGMVLFDSGGQYLDGTTDVTRTIALGPLTDTEKAHFALVLRAMLRLAEARFLHGARGMNLDILARGLFWEKGLDYKHGTGHGVGCFLCVHEPPVGFRWNVVPERNDSCVFEPGMVVSDEPGIYVEGSHGVRTENLLACRAGEENEFGKFLYFETLTYVPIDLDAVDKKYLTDEDVRRLNAYHAKVFEKLSPYMDEEEKEWLRRYTRAI